MKRNMQMKRQGVPSSGMREGHFKGWRKPHWRETRTLIGRDQFDLPIFRYEIVPPVRVKR